MRGFIQRWPKPLWALLAGALLPLAFAPFYATPIAFVSLLVLFALWQNATPKQAWQLGWVFGLGLFGVGVSWVFVAIHVFGDASIALAAALTFGFVAFLAAYIGVLGWLVKRLSHARTAHLDLLLLMPGAWFAYEWFKSWFLTGFPWLEVGTSQIDGVLSGYVPILGVLGVSWLVAQSAALILFAWQQRRLWPGVVVLVIWIGGASLQAVSWTQPVGTPIQTTLIQGNIPQATKWEPEQVFRTMALYEARTQAHWDSQLVVWPENAITAFYHLVDDFFLTPLAEQARAEQTDILLGIPTQDPETERYYNSMASLGSHTGLYHKHRLVPFGDYVPFEGLRGLIGFFDLPMSSFAKGPASQPLLQAAGQAIGVSICYEDAFLMAVRTSLPAATVLVNATNNAWYGDSFAPHQHLQISRSRALETGRPLVRVTTNGISAFVDHKGKISTQTGQFVEATLTDYVQPRSGVTPIVWMGHWGLVALWLVMMLSWWLLRYRRLKA